METRAVFQIDVRRLTTEYFCMLQARELDEPEIEQLATKLLDYEALNILSGPSIVHVEQDLLEEVVQRSQLNLVKASEIELYRAAYRYEYVKEYVLW